MLLSLQIQNFALIDRLTLNFGSGLNVLTGETGAGKSIILDALDAVLGGKITPRAVRAGTEKALIEATFCLEPALKAWLEQQEIDALEDDVLICSREMTLNGSSIRSKSRVNGVVVNKQQMEELRDRLVEITAQGQTVQLGQPSLQRDWLDNFGGDALLKQRELVATAHAAFQHAAQALEKRRQMEQHRLQQLDLFAYQAKELADAKLTDPDELDVLEQEQHRLSHSVELKQNSYQIYQLLYENDNGAAASDLLGQAEGILADMVQYDAALQPILDLVSDALAHVEEAGRQINLYGENLEADPERLEEVQQRLSKLKQICKKYGPTLAEAIALSEQLQQNMAELTDDGQSIEVLEQQYQQRQTVLERECTHLTKLRQNAAKALESQLVEELKPLAMEKVQFQVEISPTPPTAAGADKIRFLFSPNPGEPLQPLTEIASGGEMSRFLLALKACFSQIDPIGTMVFDEIDVGVSGKVAQAIAEKLHQLGHRHQVLCVTHQPLVAAMATSHYRVIKQQVEQPGQSSQNGRKQSKTVAAEAIAAGGDGPLEDAAEDVRTVVRVIPLTEDQRQDEIAQLVGGDQDALTFARSLLEKAAQTRSQQTSTPPALAPEKATAKSRSSRSKKMSEP